MWALKAAQHVSLKTQLGSLHHLQSERCKGSILTGLGLTGSESGGLESHLLSHWQLPLPLSVVSGDGVTVPLGSLGGKSSIYHLSLK